MPISHHARQCIVWSLRVDETYHDYPQFVLGVSFAWAIPVCCSLLNVDIDVGNQRLTIATLSLFAASVTWPMIYDTMYAHQDIRDDVRAGVKSMAIRFGDSTKQLAALLSATQFGLLALTGQKAGFSPAYFILTCGGTAMALGIMIAKVNLEDPSSCFWFFRRSFWYVGGCMLAGFGAEYIGTQKSEK